LERQEQAGLLASPLQADHWQARAREAGFLRSVRLPMAAVVEAVVPDRLLLPLAAEVRLVQTTHKAGLALQLAVLPAQLRALLAVLVLQVKLLASSA
jgi:hypothetical protein